MNSGADRSTFLLPTGPTSDVRGHVAAVEELLSERLETLAHAWREGAWTSDSILGAHGDVPELLTSLVMSGGKRIRPQLCWWGWTAGGAPDDGYAYLALTRVSAAIELLHTFGLAQDDVMDQSVLRRGTPALHVVAGRRHTAAEATGDAQRYGESVAVLVGDLAHTEADALVAGLPEQVRLLWWQMSVELVRGQARDLSAAARTDPGAALDRALEIAHAKSGAYTVQYPLQLGAALAGASRNVMEALAGFGRLVGLAFALRDDLLGVWGDPEVTGKPSSDDLNAGKATIMLALLEQRCVGDTRACVDRIRRQTHDGDDVRTVREALVRTGVRDAVEQRIGELVDGARDILTAGLLPPTTVEGLGAMTDRIAWRSA